MRVRETEFERDFRRELRALIRAEVPEEIRSREANGRPRVPEDHVRVHKILNAHGLAVPDWPVAWGGKKWTPMQRHIYLEELCLAHVPELLTFNVDMIGPVLARFGSEEQKRRFLPATANLDIWWCQGFSEPEAGSDLASLRTQAVLRDDEFVVNGQKAWTTQAQYADWMFALVRTDSKAPKRQEGISFLAIDMRSPGITVRPIKLLDGSYEVNEVFFNDVRVPCENLIGELNRGWTYAKFLLENERTRVARVGLIKNRLAEAKRLAAKTPLGSRTLLEDTNFRAKLVALESDLLALELTQYRALCQKPGSESADTASVLKLCGSELQESTTELLFEIAGPAALACTGKDDPGWAKEAIPNYLAERKVTIYGGSSEVQRTIIANSALGL